ncbi:hypothetical protein HMPREF9123_0133 [Neisseria bacilliformis ATCC BAA-1200]|uniref:Uncharacterized protein n=1 Tax=Neisseria bacilliformis ATCC BAA-1200 TaxID=888742 RepID=F2B8Q8_9NEIS|nr:hypothetical protein HMPREF9123_0133 [Neisseria bacilliformis ATCC BAA-1200]
MPLLRRTRSLLRRPSENRVLQFSDGLFAACGFVFEAAVIETETACVACAAHPTLAAEAV